MVVKWFVEDWYGAILVGWLPSREAAVKALRRITEATGEPARAFVSSREVRR